MANEQMAQRSTQLQQLNQQLVNQQRMFQQSLEIQRQQSQAQLGTLTNLGAAQVSKTTYGARDFQAKAFSKMKGFKGVMRTPGRTGGASSVLKLRGACIMQLRFWIGLRTDTINRFPKRTLDQLLRRRTGVTWQISTCSFTVIWFLSWNSALRVLKICALPKLKWDLMRGNLLSHKFDPRNPLRNIQLLEELLAPTQVGYSEVIARMERLEQEMRVVRQCFGDDVQDLWKSIHMVCIQKICPKILRDHLAAQASSIDAPEKQTLTIEKFLQASVHGPGASPMDVDAFAKTNGGKQGGKGKDTSCKPGKFDGKCFWCGECGHTVEDCRKKAAGKRKTAQSPRASDSSKHNGKGKGDKGKKGALSNGLMIRATKPLVRSSKRMPRLQVSSSVLSADVRSTVDRTG